MFHRMLIAAALAVGAPAIGSAIVPDLGMSQAQAQFTGRIKRVKIKKRRVGSGYKLRVVSQSDPNDMVVRGAVAFRDVNTGEVIGEVELGTPTRGRAIASGDGDFEDLATGENDTITLVYGAGIVGEDGAVEGADEVRVPIELVRSESGRLSGEGVGENGWKARLRTTRNGGVRVVIMHENRLWAGDGISEIRLESRGGTYGLLYEIVENDLLEDENYESIVNQVVETSLEVLTDVDATLEYRNGGTATATNTINVSEDAAAPVVDKVVVRETRGGDAKLVTITEGTGTSLAVELNDAETGEPVISTIDDTPISTVRHYFEEKVEFDGGEDPADLPYLMLIDMIGNDGNPVGQQYEIELTIPQAIDGDTALSSVPFGDGLGLVTVARDADGIHFGVGLKDSPSVESVNLIFEEPFDGPAPLATEINAALRSQTNKWVQKGEQSLPANFSVSANMINAEGQIVGGASGTGSSTGKAAGNGKGTRKASAQVSQQANIALL